MTASGLGWGGMYDDGQETPIEEGIGIMKASHLRIYCGPQGDVGVAETSERQNAVTVSVAEVMPLLIDAIESQRTWLDDFSDDDVTISMDLYEVLLAYQHYRRPSA